MSTNQKVRPIAGPQVQLGERVRTLRVERGISVRTLATKAGFSPSFISQLENGQVSPSIASLERIAEALGTALVGFFDATSSTKNQIVRFKNRQRLTSSWSRAKIEVLGPMGGPSRPDAVMITLSPGGRSGKNPSAHSGEEFALVFDGRITLTLGSEIHELHRGDAVTFSSETPHLWENKSSGIARILIVSSRFTH
jgi:transcriptional regulator with XRE-family HTH domain